jgi:hypothetical protein
MPCQPGINLALGGKGSVFPTWELALDGAGCTGCSLAPSKGQGSQSFGCQVSGGFFSTQCGELGN